MLLDIQCEVTNYQELKSLIEKNSLKQEIANLIKLPVARLEYLLDGGGDFSINQALIICKRFDIPIDCFLKGV